MGNKKRKIEDENRGFNDEWTFSYAFVSNSKGLPSCLICKQVLSNNKKSNVVRHFETKHETFSHLYPDGDSKKKAIEELKCDAIENQNMFLKWLKTSSNTTAASFAISHEIVKRGKPFTDGEYIKDCFINVSEHLFSDFINKKDIIKKIRDVPLSAKTVRDRTIKLGTDISDKQIKDINSSSGFSIACDESCDGTDVAQIALLCRYVNSDGPQEELIDLIPLTNQTRGEDVFKDIISCLETKQININCIVSVATDGAPSMIGKYKGFVALLKKKINHDIISFHCIIHQEALCANSFPHEFNEVMELVTKIVNKIVAKGLNHRQFRELLEETDCQYSDLLLHNKVRWLSKGRVLERFSACLNEIILFLQSKGDMCQELTSPEWMEKFYFMVDMTFHLNVLNRKLQGKGSTAISLLEEVLSFERKFSLFVRDLENSEFLFFPSLKKYNELTRRKINVDILINAVSEMEMSFKSRFQEFRNEKFTLMFVVNPLNANIYDLNFSAFPNVNRAELELEIVDLNEKEVWASKFRTLLKDLESLERNKALLADQHKWDKLQKLQKQDQMIFEVWNVLPNSYVNSKNYAFGILSIFGSTYLCEQVFSSMNLIKCKLRNRLNADSLKSCLKLKTTSYIPNIEKLSKETEKQKSH